MSGRDCKIEFDGSLPDDSAGGVVGSTLGGKIKVDNTLEERLKILREKVSALSLQVSEVGLTRVDVAGVADCLVRQGPRGGKLYLLDPMTQVLEL